MGGAQTTGPCSLYALFEALLSADASRAHTLLQPGGGHQLSHAWPCGFTTAHAAVIGGCAQGALPALAAAGAPLDSALEVWGGSEPLRQFLDEAGVPSSKRTDLLWKGSTPLALAARCVRAGQQGQAGSESSAAVHVHDA